MLNACMSFLLVASFVLKKKCHTYKYKPNSTLSLFFIQVVLTVYADLTALDVTFESVSRFKWIMTTSL